MVVLWRREALMNREVSPKESKLMTEKAMTLHGVDVYIWQDEQPALPTEFGGLTLKLISNRGTKVYPGPAPEMDLLDWFRCRYFSESEVSDVQVNELITALTEQGFRWTKTQKLFQIDGVDAFSQPY